MGSRLLALSALAIVLAAGGGTARAQSFYEGKTVRLIVGFAPGGGFDTYARSLAPHGVDTFPAIPRSSSRT
jgi:tripartite-type tricarboxylate transporter receptor subunit TctC